MKEKHKKGEKLNLLKFSVSGVLLSLILFLCASFPLLNYALLATLHWFSTDLYRSCSGFGCIRILPLGYVVLAAISIGVTAVVFLLFLRGRKKSDWGIFSNVFFGTVLGVPLLILVGFGFGATTQYMPDMPFAFRCAGTIAEGPDVQTDGFLDPHVSCILRLAEDTNNIQWCDSLEGTILDASCVGRFAARANDPSICSRFDGNKYELSSCLDVGLAESEYDGDYSVAKKLVIPIDDTYQSAGNAAQWHYYPEGDIEGEPEIAWSFEGSRVSPVYGDGKLFLGGSHFTPDDADHQVGALDAVTGEPLWTNLPDGYFSTVSELSISQGLLIVPAFGRLIGIDVAGGKEEWRHEFDSLYSIDQVLLAQDAIYGVFNNERRVVSVDLLTGMEDWSVEDDTRSSIDSSRFGFAALSRDALVYVFADNYKNFSTLQVYELDTGDLRFERKLENVEDGYDVLGMPVVDGDRLFLRMRTGVQAVDLQTGDDLDFFDLSSVRGPATSHMAYDGDALFLAESERSVVRLDPESGGIEWRLEVYDPIASAPVVTDSYVYVGTENQLVAIDKFSGDAIWGVDVVNGFDSDLVAGSEGVYYLSSSGRLNAIR